MIRFVFFSLAVFLTTQFTPGLAQDKVVKKIIEIGTADNQTMHHLDVLCNRFGGRLVGSDALLLMH